MIVWVIAGLLALATGMRIGWALVHRQSVVSSAMIVALGSLTLLAALNWPPLTRLIDAALRWPNISVGLSEVALVASAAGSCVMITSVATTRGTASARRLAVIQYSVAAVIAAVTLTVFLSRGRAAEMAPRDYLARAGGASWLVPLLYVMLALTLVAWVGMRLANPTRRGRALFVFTAGMALIVAATAFVLLQALAGTDRAGTDLGGIATAGTLLLCAMAMAGLGALLPAVEDWLGSRRELRLIQPLLSEMERRHPDIGIGVRPRGPLAFRVAEQLSSISDALYLEGLAGDPSGDPDTAAEPVGASITEQAGAVARWIAAGPADVGTAFPGRAWLRQPAGCSDRDWILEIARQYRDLAPAGG